MARVTNNRPQRRDEEYERITKRRKDRTSIRFFPDVFIFIIAAVLIILGYKALFPSTPAKDKVTEGSPEVTGLVINEIMALNKGALASGNGEYYDWIELYNGSTQMINLQSFSLSDNKEKLAKFVFPNYLLNPGEYVIVYCSATEDETPENELHADFKLSSSGEDIVLTDTHNVILDSVTYPSLGIDMVYARLDGQWQILDYYTPMFENSKEGYSAYLKTRWAAEKSPVVINEIMSSNNITLADENGDYSDWVELYNTSDTDVNLKGYALSDDPLKPKQWILPDVTIKGGGYLVIFCSGKNRIDPQGTLHTTFALNSYADSVVFSNPKGQILEQIDISNLDSDSSFGRVQGTDEWQVFTHATPANPNTDEGFNAYQEKLFESLKSTVIINEVMSGNESTYKNDDGEYVDWIELYNRGSDAVNLKGWALSDNTGDFGKWRFPDITIDSGEYIIVYCDGKSSISEASKKKLHASFSLSATGENLVLVNNEGKLMDQCSLPQMDFETSYGRAAGANVFSYILSPTPGAQNKSGYLGYAPAPSLSVTGGLYDSEFSVKIISPIPDNMKVVYTTDCAAPSEQSTIYKSGQEIKISKTTILRVRSYIDGYLPSKITTSSYIMGAAHTLPVISVSTDPDLLYSTEKGILAMGDNPGKFPYKGANFWKNWEIGAHVELIDYGNIVALDQDCGIRVFGAYSRANKAKNLALFARSKYGDKGFDYPIFSESNFKSYGSFVLRNGASEWNMSKIRDVMCASLVRETTNLDTQLAEPSVYYLNGEYQGVYFIQEKVNEDFFVRKYGVSKESVNLLVGNGNKSSFVQSGSNEDWLAILEYVKNNSLAVQENYDYIASKVDIDNYMDYVICEVYVANTDTGNIKYWMSPERDGKWRFIFYDVDWAFMQDNANWDSLSKYLNVKGHGVSNMFDNSLIRALLENPSFKEAFLKRFAYHLKVTFATDHVVSRIDSIAAMIDSEMPADKAKWGYGDYNAWLRHVEYLRVFARKRPEYMKSFIQNYFALTSEQMQEYFG